MPHEIIVMPRAARQLRRATDWIAIARPEAVAIEVLLDPLLEQLREFPELGLRVARGRRRILIAGTPFSVLYRVRSRSATIQILALLDGRRG